MWRKVGWLTGLALVVLLSSTVYAQGPADKHSEPFWQASYWNNVNLDGEPVVQNTAAQINWYWGLDAPYPAVNVDRFSARWTRCVDVTAGSYRFTATSDDGIRVYVDNQPVIDQWNDHPERTHTGDVKLTTGHHLITVEYYEKTGVAVAKVSWSQVSIGSGDWQGEYFDNRWLLGPPVLVREDEHVDFSWGYGSPETGIPSDGFSVRWQRSVNMNAGLYRFTTTTDDGVRVWVKDYLLIDRWQDQASTAHSGTMYLSGQVQIKLEYYENTGMAAAKLTWVPVDDPPPTPVPSPAVVVDNSDPGFIPGGSNRNWRAAEVGHNGAMIWTRNNDRARSNYNWGRWYPDLEAGRYEVFAYIPRLHATTTQARYWVSHRDGYTLRLVSQLAISDGWVSLGTYSFRGTRDDHVSLSDVTYESYLSRHVAFDAVKWERR